MKKDRPSSHHVTNIYPVILRVPSQYDGLKGREQVQILSRLARQALELSANNIHIRLGELTKDSNGVPLPFQGHYWSLTHKPKYVGAVISPSKVGIDVEEIKSISDAMFNRIASDREWALANVRSKTLFFRFWTAKEAVLKAEGVGMTGLSKCTVTQILNHDHLVLEYAYQTYHVEQIYFNNHIASIVTNDCRKHWIMGDAHLEGSK